MRSEFAVDTDWVVSKDLFAVWLNPTLSSAHSLQLWLVSNTSFADVSVSVAGYHTREVKRQGGAGPPFATQYELIPTSSSTKVIFAKRDVALRICNGRKGGQQTRGNGHCKTLMAKTVIANGSKSSWVWRDMRKWNSQWEALFSIWVQHLFRPLPSERNRGWHRLHDVLRNPERNFLYNQLGYVEDDPNSTNRIRAKADCGDLPYMLRAYFSWKFSLPFRYSECTRGTGQKGPRCMNEVDNRNIRHESISHPVARFNAFLKVVSYKVHSGTYRTLPVSDTSDFYPVALSRDTIRPGTVFVDPGGHVLLVSQWDADGLYAVDGHPDKTVTRRPFKPKFFPHYPRLTTGGFKAFRPFRRRNEHWIPVPNSQLKSTFSRMQYRFQTPNEFYQRVGELMIH
ncbi:MAG: hypothetical protein JXR76_14605 [Deltaproteobacteria bacterium]|nr:hypothetical protein [Deltaproteobacteria bacterium]